MYRKFKASCISLFFILSLSAFVSESFAFVSVLTRAGRYVAELSDDIIVRLANIGKSEGRPALGRELALYAKNVPGSCREQYLEAVYLKILVAQNRLTKVQAEEFLHNLSGVKGFRSTLSKMSGKVHDANGLHFSSDPNAVGHGFELEFANALVKGRYTVLEIGAKFSDGIKKGMTDIDVLVSSGSKHYAFELKNYGKHLDDNSLITFRKDIETLRVYSEKNPGTKCVFLLSNKPANIDHVKLIEAYGKLNNVKIIYGDAETAVRLLEILL